MKFETSKQSRGPVVSEAMQQIASIEQQTQVMGANDYEPSAFVRIRERLERNEISPQQAITEAQAILDSKMDYH